MYGSEPKNFDEVKSEIHRRRTDTQLHNSDKLLNVIGLWSSKGCALQEKEIFLKDIIAYRNRIYVQDEIVSFLQNVIRIEKYIATNRGCVRYLVDTFKIG
jgi:hypothetical protein